MMLAGGRDLGAPVVRWLCKGIHQQPDTRFVAVATNHGEVH